MPAEKRPRAKKEELEKFRRDAKKLLETHPSGEIAAKLDLDPGNFSSYVNGSKNPGKEIIEKFYKLKEMENSEDKTQNSDDNKAKSDYQQGGPGSSFGTGETQASYMVDLDDLVETRQELFRNQKTTSYRHWTSLQESILASQMWAKSKEEEAKADAIKSRTTEKLVDELLSRVKGDAAS